MSLIWLLLTLCLELFLEFGYGQLALQKRLLAFLHEKARILNAQLLESLLKSLELVILLSILCELLGKSLRLGQLNLLEATSLCFLFLLRLIIFRQNFGRLLQKTHELKKALVQTFCVLSIVLKYFIYFQSLNSMIYLIFIYKI